MDYPDPGPHGLAATSLSQNADIMALGEPVQQAKLSRHERT